MGLKLLLGLLLTALFAAPIGYAAFKSQILTRAFGLSKRRSKGRQRSRRPRADRWRRATNRGGGLGRLLAYPPAALRAVALSRHNRNIAAALLAAGVIAFRQPAECGYS